MAFSSPPSSQIVKLRHTRVAELRAARTAFAVARWRTVHVASRCLPVGLPTRHHARVSGSPAGSANRLSAHLLEWPLKALGVDDDPETIHRIAFITAFATISLSGTSGKSASSRPNLAALRKPEAMPLRIAAPPVRFLLADVSVHLDTQRQRRRCAAWLFGLGNEGGHSLMRCRTRSKQLRSDPAHVALGG